jgi:hypothetical protein
MTPDETAMFVFNRIFMGDIRIDDAPEIGVVDKSGRYRRRGRRLDDGRWRRTIRGAGRLLNETRVSEERDWEVAGDKQVH